MTSFKRMIELPILWQTVGTSEIRRSYTAEEWRLMYVEAGTDFLYALRRVANAGKFLSMNSAHAKTRKPKLGASCTHIYIYIFI